MNGNEGSGPSARLAPHARRRHPRRHGRPITGSRLRALVQELNVRRIELEMQNEALREARHEREDVLALYEEIFDFVPVGLLGLNARGMVEEINAHCADLLSTSREKALGRPFVTFLAPEDVGPFLSHLMRSGANGAAASVDVRVGSGDKRDTPVRLDTRLVREEGGRTFRYRTAVIDLAPLRMAERERASAAEERAQRAEAEAASRAKSAFLATVSHEMRTPLTSILGFGQLLLASGKIPDEQMRHLRTLVRNGEQLHRIINDILDLAKVEAERLDVEPGEVEPVAFVLDLLESFVPQAREKGLDLRARSAGPVPRCITTDPGRLRQILSNVVSNALKFTDSGLVEIVVHSEAEGNPLPRRVVHFTVKDTGKGIPEARKALLFEPFEQGDPSTARRYGGTGLGLALSRKLAHLLGGDVQLVSSHPGHGSTFRISIEGRSPRWEHAAPISGLGNVGVGGGARSVSPIGSDAAAAGSGSRILHARLGAASPGANTDRAAGPVAASAVSRRLIETPLPALAAAPATPPATPLSTAACGPTSDARPVSIPSQSQSIAGATKTQREPLLRGKRVLVVDDSLDILEFIRLVLLKEGATVEMAHDGLEGARKSLSGHYDVVLMDLHMPVLDGAEAVRSLRTKGYRGPIVALTANALQDERFKLRGVGFDGYVTKPVDKDELARLVASFDTSGPLPLH